MAVKVISPVMICKPNKELMQTYQLHICVKNNIKINIGKLGNFTFPKGKYIYTGSAKKSIDSRIARHKSKLMYKKLHWHIDYLLSNTYVEIIKVEKSAQEECILNAKTKGQVVVEKFGNSDCRAKCKSHLKYIG